MNHEFKEQDLIECGYRKFHNVGIKYADYGFEKKIYDDNGGVLYFIHIFYYAHPELKSCMFDSQFYFENGGVADLQLSDFKTIDEIEKFAAEFYEKFGCVPYYKK